MSIESNGRLFGPPGSFFVSLLSGCTGWNALNWSGWAFGEGFRGLLEELLAGPDFVRDASTLHLQVFELRCDLTEVAEKKGNKKSQRPLPAFAPALDSAHPSSTVARQLASVRTSNDAAGQPGASYIESV